MNDREKDARAAEAVGWKLDYEFEDMLGAPTVPHLRDQYDEWGILPAFGSDPAAALSLLAAVPPERRAAVGARLLRALGYEPATATMVLLSFEDVWRLIVEATPQRIRDAVLDD